MLTAWPDALIVHNKSDLGADTTARPGGLSASALSGEGIDRLIEAIVAHLVPQRIVPGDAVPITPEQLATIVTARDALAHGDHDACRTSLMTVATVRRGLDAESAAKPSPVTSGA